LDNIVTSIAASSIFLFFVAFSGITFSSIFYFNLAFTFFSSLFIYSYLRNDENFSKTVIASLGILLYLAIELPSKLMLSYLLLAPILFFYHKAIRGIGRFRNQAVFKLILVSLSWSYSLLFVPILFYHSQINSNDILLLLSLFLFIFAMTIPFELRDRTSDKHSGIINFAEKFGNKSSIVISISLLFFGFITEQFYLQNELMSLFSLLFFLVSFVLVYLSTKVSQHLFVLIFDGFIAIKYLTFFFGFYFV